MLEVRAAVTVATWLERAAVAWLDLLQVRAATAAAPLAA